MYITEQRKNSRHDALEMVSGYSHANLNNFQSRQHRFQYALDNEKQLCFTSRRFCDESQEIIPVAGFNGAGASSTVRLVEACCGTRGSTQQNKTADEGPHIK